MKTGEVDYSAPVKIELDNSLDIQRKFSIIYAGPNPISEWLSLSFYAPVPATYRYFLTDMAGRQHLSGEIQADKGEHTSRIRLPELGSGMYGFTLFSGVGKDYVNLVKD